MRHPKDITINGKQLDKILKAHKAWLMDEEGGSRAVLRGADLRGADLRDAVLSGADLRGADLSSADLSGADLRGAVLRDAKNTELAAAITTITPEGDLIGWKKLAMGKIAKLLIPATAKRSNATGRKCRAEYVDVLEIWNGGKSVPTGASQYNTDFVYRVGERIYPDKWDDNRWDECSHGIHFFITRLEAEQY